MTIWEKVIINMEKPAKKIAAGAAVFSERVRAEIAIARLKIRLDEVRSVVREQERLIGRRVLQLRKKDELPRTTDLLLRDEEIVMALAEITSREKDLEDIYSEIENEQASFRDAEKSREESAQ
jgi:hypothetical protein